MFERNNRHTSAEWCELLDMVVLDPDGWDRMNFMESWDERISEHEFRTRAAVSTVYYPIKQIGVID